MNAAASEGRAWFACGSGCEGEHPLDRADFHCPRCGDLLDVQHDLAALAKTSAREWKSRFACPPGTGPAASGVWSKKAWVLPSIEEQDLVTLGEGFTPLVRAERLGAALGVGDLWIKQCGVSHTGSFKDLGMTVLVSAVQAMRRKGAAPAAVACASTGDTSAALAAYGAAAGMRTLVLLPRARVSIAQLLQPLAHGALVLSLGTDFDGCMRIVQRLAAEGRVYLANSMNPLRIEGQKTVSIEVTQQLGWEEPDWIALPGGNLGNTAAVGAGLGMMESLGLAQRRARILVAQAAAANPLYRSAQVDFADVEKRPAGETVATAIRIGDPVSIRRAIRALRRYGGAVEQASENEIAHASAVADRAGMFVDPQTACALVAVQKRAAAGEIARGQRVVVVSTAHGLKFSETKVAFHEGRGPKALQGAGDTIGIMSPELERLRSAPIEIDGDYAGVLRAIESA